MIVNKRYYDFDYDNNRIVMFDADEIEMSLNSNDSPLDERDPHPSHQVSQSTETVPDDPILGASNPNDKTEEKESKSSPEPAACKDEEQGVVWISSESHKGSRRIPYALQFTHSYAINKLEVTLAQLVDTKTVQRQQQQKQQAQQQQALALRKKWVQQQQQQQLRYGHVPDPRYAQHGQHPHYRAPYPPAPHAQDPRYAHYRGHAGHAGHPAAAYGHGRSHAAQVPPVSGSRKDYAQDSASPSQSPYMAHARVHPHAYPPPVKGASKGAEAVATTNSKAM